MLQWIFTFNLLFFTLSTNSVSEGELSSEAMLQRVNALRAKGCKCGNMTMPPTDKLIWNPVLTKSAMAHAKEMHDYKFFSHYSKTGKNIGERLDAFGYRWAFAGENIGEGQKSFDEVLNDWKKSVSHCKMLMNPKANELGIAHYKGFWVQHFGKQLD